MTDSAKAARKARKAQKKAAKKQYERNHAQLKRTQVFSTAALAAQVRRGKKAAKSET
jgi:hypothetical protein